MFACSTAVIFIKISGEHPCLLAAYRLLIATFLLSPLFLRELRKSGKPAAIAAVRHSVGPGVLLGLHFITWIMGARMTPAAHSNLIVNMTPIAMPFFLFLLSRELVNRREIAGTVLGLAGTVVLAGSDLRWNTRFAQGDMLCLVSMLFFAWYLAAARRHRRSTPLWLYVVPLYAVAGVFCFAVACCFVNPIKAYPLDELRLFICLGAIPTVMGHSILNHSMRTLRGQTVAIVNLAQFIFAGTLAFVILLEVPGLHFYLACLLIVSGALVAIRGSSGAPEPARA